MEATTADLVFFLGVVVAVAVFIGAVWLISTLVYRVKHRDDPRQ